MKPLEHSLPHRVYIHASYFGERWFVQYLETDLKTPVGYLHAYKRIDQVMEILKRANCSRDQWRKFEEGIQGWGIGACYLDLTGEQYQTLKQS